MEDRLHVLVRDAVSDPPLSKTYGELLFHNAHPETVLWAGCVSADGGQVALVGQCVLVSCPTTKEWCWKIDGNVALEGLPRYVSRGILVRVWDDPGGRSPVATVMWQPYLCDAPLVLDAPDCDVVFQGDSMGVQDVPLDWIVGVCDLKKGDKSLLQPELGSEPQYEAIVTHEIYCVKASLRGRLVSGKTRYMADPSLRSCHAAYHTPDIVGDREINVPLPIGDPKEGSCRQP